MKFTPNINIVVSLISCFVLHLISYSPYGDYPHYLSIFSSFFVFYPFYEFVFNKRLLNIFILPFISLNWVYFQSPFLLQEKTKYYPRHILEEFIPDIALFSSISIVLIFIGFFFFFNNISAITSRKLKLETTTLVKLTYLFVVLGIVYRLGEAFFPAITLSLSNVIQILFYSPTIALALYGMILIRTKSYPKLSLLHIVVILFTLYELLFRLSTTMFVGSFLLFSGIFFTYIYEKRKMPIIYLIITGILFLPFYFTRNYYRTHSKLLNDNTEGKFSASKGADLVTNIFSEKGQDDFDSYNSGVEKKWEGKYDKNRFENLSLISQVVYHHNRKNKPFLYGETFYWLPVAPIPRIIFPDKPKNLLNSELAIAYGLRGKSKITTSINFPMIAEAYVNFGFWGMPLMALLFGIAFKWFTMKIGSGYGDINILIAINIIKQLVHAEGNITLVFGALIQVLLFWFVIIKIFKLDKWKPQEQSQELS